MADHSEPALVVTEQEAARMLRLSVRTLQRLRIDGGGPPFCSLTPNGRRIAYPVGSIHAWLQQRIVRSTSEATVGKSKAAA
jgi:predicted DNA-binding transcriptional regulator AlpA